MPPAGTLLISPSVALIAALGWVGFRSRVAGQWCTDVSATRLRRRWWGGVVLAFGVSLFLEVLIRFARPGPPGEESLEHVVLWSFSVLAGIAWFALIAFLFGDEVRFDAVRVERRHPFRKTSRIAFTNVESVTLQSSLRLQTSTIHLAGGGVVVRLDPTVRLFARLAARILESLPAAVVRDSRLRPFLLPLAQPDRFGWDARDQIGYAPDGSEDEFDPNATFVGDDDEGRSGEIAP